MIAGRPTKKVSQVNRQRFTNVCVALRRKGDRRLCEAQPPASFRSGGCDQKEIADPPQPFEIGTRFFGHAGQEMIQVGETIVKNLDPLRIETVFGVQKIGDTSADDRVERHQLSLR